MSPDSDGGIDSKSLLAALSGSTGEPQEAAPAPAAPSPRLVSSLPRPWLEHRSELAAIVTAFVGVVWCGVGLALGVGWPLLLGLAFAASALAIGKFEIGGLG